MICTVLSGQKMRLEQDKNGLQVNIAETLLGETVLTNPGELVDAGS